MSTLSLLFLDMIIEYRVAYIIWFVLHCMILIFTFNNLSIWVIYLKMIAEDKNFIIEYSYKPLTPSFINELKPRKRFTCFALSILFNCLFDLYFVISFIIDILFRLMFWNKIREIKRRINER